MSHCPTLAPLGKGCACTLPTPHWRAVPGPKVVYCSSVQFLPGGLSAGTGKLNCQTARSISLVDSDCSLNTSTERKRQVCVRHVQSKRQRRLPPPAAFPCRLKPTVPCEAMMDRRSRLAGPRLRQKIGSLPGRGGASSS